MEGISDDILAQTTWNLGQNPLQKQADHIFLTHLHPLKVFPYPAAMCTLRAKNKRLT